MQQDFLYILKNVLIPMGEFLFKTDHPEYYEWVVEEIGLFNENNTGSPFKRKPWPEEGKQSSFFYPKTDFQRLWEGQGKKLWGLVCELKISEHHTDRGRFTH